MTSLNNLSTSDVNRLSDERKRKINMIDWKNVKNKTLRNSGKEYISQTDTEEDRKKIEIDSKLHHSKADQSYDALKKDTDIANARLEKPFRIIEMSQNDFKDFSALEQDIAKKNLKITQAMWLKLTADAPKHVNIRESHNTLKPWTSHQIRQNNFKDNTLSPAYESPVALTKEKKKDLLDLCKYMPQQYSDFYTSLPG
ncbi:hypothetical protein QTP88_001130 [Uroleucon formosanum]